jgi:hypothetical protein
MIFLHSARQERFFKRPHRSLSVGAGFLALFVALALLVPAEPLAIEQHWADWMREIQTPLLEHVALIFNYLGRGLGRALVLVGIGVVVIAAKRWSTDRDLPTVSSIPPAPPFPPATQPSPAQRASQPCSYSRKSTDVAVFGGRSVSQESPAWRGAAPTSRCTGCSTSSAVPSSVQASP